ncbi:hypothetical protein TrLO_g7870 [Triparma laevis f. longispina]|uniref:FANCL C-terminal domain-containing protein n=1 Tax=Triparma laevis f. longispina TaxID=1714387 RepID=A0A9W7A0P2_9STRA|nr:hypothetical protein TrLO_g7870 [Triparma laevis f. longispina]
MIVFDDVHEYSRIVFYPPVQQAVVPPFDATFHYQLESKATNPKLLDPADIRRVEMRSDTQAVSFAELDSAVVARLKAALDLKVDSQAAPMDLLSQSETLFSELLRTIPPPPPPPSSKISNLEAVANFVASLDEKVTLLPDSSDLEVEWVSSASSFACSFTLTNPVKIDLPDKFVEREQRPPRGCSLAQLHQFCIALCKKYEPLYHALDNLASHFTVIDPPLPCPNRVVSRRLLCHDEEGRAMSVEVELAALDPRTRPTKFRAIADVGNRVMEKYRAFGWDESVPVEENLKTACAVSFPHPSSSVGAEEEDDADILCGICYGYKLVIDTDNKENKQELPDIVCPTPNCAKPYHHSCLFEWLRGDRESTISFDRIYGSCMYCEGKVSCKMRDGTE